MFDCILLDGDANVRYHFDEPAMCVAEGATAMVKMVKKVIVSLALTLAAIVPLSADVRYTMHTESRIAAGAAADPISQMAGGMLAQMFPAGGIDQVIVQSPLGMRSEQKQGFATIKAGSVTLMRADGSLVTLDPASKTYWKQSVIPAEAAAAAARMAPEIKVVKRGEFETINGMKAEHMTLQMKMSLPVDVSQLPPGMSPDLTLKYDVWVTDEIKASGGQTSLSGSLLKQFGMGDMKELNDGRTMLKGVMSMFGVEIVMTTSGFSTEKAPAELFEVPKDYKEVPPPGGGMPTPRS